MRELRLLAAHAPPYNRRSKFPHRWWWIVLTDEAFPRFSVVRTPRGDRAVGPFRSRADAVETAALLARFTGVRTCTNRIARSAHHGPACPERELSPCPAPRDIAAAEYAEAPLACAGADRRRRQRRAGAPCCPASPSWPTRNRYETAARLRDHAAAAIDVLWRGQRLRALASVPELVAARPDGDGGWHLAVIRCGQLAAAASRAAAFRRCRWSTRYALRHKRFCPSRHRWVARSSRRSALIARWLAQPGVRIVRAEPGWTSPLGSAGRWASWAASARSARLAAEQTSTAQTS